MRRSRLYLTLSIVSMMVAFGLGVAQKRCGYTKCKAAKQDVVEVDARSFTKPVWDAMYARDFDRMAAEATALIDSAHPDDAYRLRAYALRGQGRYAEAAATYTSVLRHTDELIVEADCHIGRAFCRHKLGQEQAAREDIERAKLLAQTGVEEMGDAENYYQLACAYAVEASILRGGPAEKSRIIAIGKFQRAIEKGYRSWQHARADLDLDALRGDQKFENLFPHP